MPAMPTGVDDYDVVIGVNVADRTGAGLNDVEKNLKKTSDQIKQYGDKQAREFAKNSRDMFGGTAQDATKSASGIIKNLVNIFDTHNFLLRNMARQAGSTSGAIAIGIGKMILSYQKLGQDTEEASHRGRVALDEMKRAIANIGTDGDAIKNAIKATRDLAGAYEGMGKTANAASIKAGSILEEAIYNRVTKVQSGLLKAQEGFEKLRAKGSTEAQILGNKINDISASLKVLLGGASGDAAFFRAFIKAEDQAKKYLLVLERLGPRAAVAFQTNELAVDKLANAFIKLEARSGRLLSGEGEKLAASITNINKYKKELADLEAGLTDVAKATTETGVATEIFGGIISGTTLIIGGIIAVVVAAIAAVVGFGYAMYKGTKVTMEYGDELYKLSISTGLTVKTLSALNIIAKETGTQVDSLAKTFNRTQIQVQRGLDKPFSEAGRALRTLGVNFADLRKANPDQQVFMLAKAFSELNNQNVRATVSTQLFSRDAEKQSKMILEIANNFDEAGQKAKKFGTEMDESGAVKAHMMAVAVSDLDTAWQGLWINLGLTILPQLTILMEKFTQSVFNTGGAFHWLGDIASVVLHEIRLQIEIIREQYHMKGGIFEQVYTGMTTGVSARQRAQGILDKEDAAQKAEYEKRIKELKDLQKQGDDQYAPGKGSGSHKMTDLERLLEQVKKMRFEISALQETGSYANQLRFELEDLQKVKSFYEEIFKLRKAMGLDLNAPLPKYRLFGTPEEQAQDLANLESYNKQMLRMKSIFDDVVKVANEQADALAELAKVRQEALMPVVDAGTRAEIKYYTAFRERMKAEKELTADVIAEAKLRSDAVKDEVGNFLKAYMTLKRDVGRAQDTTREQTAQDRLFNQVMAGQVTPDQLDKMRQRMGETQAPIIPNELTTIAAHAATIDLNVQAIAEKLGANVTTTTQTTLTSQPSSGGYATSSLVMRNPDGSVKILSQEDLNAPDDLDVVRTSTNDATVLRQQIIDAAMAKAAGARETATRAANQSILDESAALSQELIDIDLDYLQHYKAQERTRRDEARATAIDIMLAEKDISDLHNSNSERYKQVWQAADDARIQSLKGLAAENIKIQNDIANNGFDMNDRLTNARLKSIREIQEASNHAAESIVADQVKIADQTVYHADVANAAVMDFLASQKGITQIIGDAKVKAIDTTFSAIDTGLSKLTAKLGLAGDLVKQIMNDFIRLALTPFFRTLFGGQAAVGGGGTFAGAAAGGFGGGGFGGGGGIFGVPGAPAAGGGLPGLQGLQGTIQSGLANLETGGGGLTIPPSVSGSGSNAMWHALAQQNLTPNNLGSMSAMAQFKQGIGGALPFLGLSLGVQAGGQSLPGSILGGAGGLIAGGIGAAALTPGLFAASGIFGSMGPAMLAMLTNPITAVVAGALITGAIILKVNKERRKNEEVRNDLSIQTTAALEEMYQSALAGNLTPAEADKKFADLKTQYFQQISGFDGKTKRIATEWWDGADHPPQVYWAKIKAAAEKGETAANIRDRMVPVFASGGYSSETQLIKVRPGEGVKYPGTNVIQPVFGKDRGYDTEYMYAPKGTRILNQSEMGTAEGFQFGGTVGGNGLPTLQIDSMELNIDADGLATIVISSPHFKKAVIGNVKIGKKEKKIA